MIIAQKLIDVVVFSASIDGNPWQAHYNYRMPESMHITKSRRKSIHGGLFFVGTAKVKLIRSCRDGNQFCWCR